MVWGEGDDQLHPLQGAIVVWGKGRVTANLGGVDVVPLQGAIVVCYGLGEGDGQLWGVDGIFSLH